MAKFIFFSPVHFEQWDYRNSVTKGIGGSETSHVEMCWRLASRGHTVISYAPIPKDCQTLWRNTEWRHIDKVDWEEPGIWVLYRCPEYVDKLKNSKDQRIWIVCQDEYYGAEAFTNNRVRKIEKILALSEEHAKLLKSKHPNAIKKICVTGNGIKLNLIQQIEKQNNLPPRNPKRLTWASSPDRGLLCLCKIFKNARIIDPNLELHIFYGLNNINKLSKQHPQFAYYNQFKKELMQAIDQPNIFWRGRVNQRTLYKEWLQTGLWVYPTCFFETNCITSQEAQALGAIPITNPYGALINTIKHGTLLPGNVYDDRLVQSRYVAEIIRLSCDQNIQEQIRLQMMHDARMLYNWEVTVDLWEGWALNIDNPVYVNQFSFQLRYIHTNTNHQRINPKSLKILNVGCDNDIAGFKEKYHCVNLDVIKQSPFSGATSKADILADIRTFMPDLCGKFDRIILGDIIEHFLDPNDAILTLQNVAKYLKNKSSYIILTCPEDYRPVSCQHIGQDGTDLYTTGVSAFHHTPITKKILINWFKRANLLPVIYQQLNTVFFNTHCFILKRN